VAPYSLPDAPWRHEEAGVRTLIGVVPANRFHDADKDPGVWVFTREDFDRTGGLNERLSLWGFQTQEWVARLKHLGMQVVQIEDYLFCHQHHWAPRDFQAAHAQFTQHIR